MQMASAVVDLSAPISGHVYLRGKSSIWYAKWRDQQGQHQKRLGRAWTGKGTPPSGYLRRREAQALLEEILVEARRGKRRQERTGVTFKDIGESWYERESYEKDWSEGTRRDNRSILDAHLLPELGDRRPESITTKDLERFRDRLASEKLPSSDGGTKHRSRTRVNKIFARLSAILKYATKHFGLVANPAEPIEPLRETYDAARFDFYTPEEIDLIIATAASGAHRDPKWPAVSDTERALRAEEDQQDAVIYLTAALTGLRRSELLTLLLWRDVDFEQSSLRVFEAESSKKKRKPKSRKSRTVPMVEEVAEALKELGRRGHHTDPSDHVFVNRSGEPLDGSALRRRYIRTLDAAGLRRLRFHDLRHTFGSHAINGASIVQVQAWMGHSDITTTQRYLHHKSRADDARLLSAAFKSARRTAA